MNPAKSLMTFLYVISALIINVSLSGQYILQDQDVEVVNGVIETCTYNFENKDIIIPDTLDGQAVMGIPAGHSAGKEMYEGVFVGKGIRSVVLPSTLHRIGDYAFIENAIEYVDLSKCKYLDTIGASSFQFNSISMLDMSHCISLAVIRYNAFDNNPLSAVDLSGCLSLSYIGEYAFRSYDLEQLDLEGCNALISIGAYAFSYGALTYLDLSTCSSLEVIQDGAFMNNELDSINLSGCETITSIGSNAFARNRLSRLDLSHCPSLQSIELTAFYSNQLSEIILQNPELRFIGGSALFSNHLSEVDLSDCHALVWIGENAFAENPSLDQIILPQNYEWNVLGWKDNFGNLYDSGQSVADFSRLYYVPIPYSLTREDVTVSDGYITQCSSTLKEIEIIIPDTLDGQVVKGIADRGATNGVFYKKPFKSVRFPSTMEYIGDGAFSQSSLISIDLRACKDLKNIGRSAFRGNDLTRLNFEGCTSLTEIGAWAFNDNDITTIDFNGCPNLSIIGENTFDTNSLIDIDLASCSALMRVDRGAFMNNILETIILPVNAPYTGYGWKDAGDHLFAGGDTIEDLSSYYYVPVTHVLQDPEVEIVAGVIRSSSYNNQYRQIAIPEILDGQVVTGIGDMDYRMVFASKGIVFVTLPASVELIGEGAFFQNDLRSIDLTDCTSLTVIGLNAFLANDSLDHLLLPVPEIPGFIFDHWTDNGGTSYSGGDTVRDFAAEYTAVLEPTCELIIYVLEGDDPVTGAQVTVEGIGTMQTDATGSVTIHGIVPGTCMNIYVSASATHTAADTIVVLDSITFLTIEFTKSTAIADPLSIWEDFSLYPNPATAMIYIHLPIEAVVSVLDLNGKILDEYRLERGNHRIPLVQLESGVYLVNIASGKMTVSRLIVVH